MNNENTDQTVNLYKRVTNFTKQEEEKLIVLVLKNKDIIESKKTDAATCKLKKEVWEKIAYEFNSSSNKFRHYRDARSIREKYQNIKRKLRRSIKTNKIMERFTPPKKKTVCASGVISSIDDDDEMEKIEYLETDIPEKDESVTNYETIYLTDFSDCGISEVDDISIPNDDTDYQLPSLPQPSLEVRSKYKNQAEVYSENEELVALERQILEEQLRNLKTQKKNVDTERLLRVDQATKEHRVRVKYAETEHLLRVELLRVQIKLHQKNSSKRRA